MSDYIIPTTTGSITVPHAQRLDYKDLILVGRDDENWNEPIQRNFVYLRDLSDKKLDKDFDQDLVPVSNGSRSLGTPAKQFKSLYLKNSVQLDGARVLYHVGGVVTFNGKEGKTLRIQSLGNADVELGSTGSGKVVSLSDLLLGANKSIGTVNGSPLKFLQKIKVMGDVEAPSFNGIDLLKLATKAEIPDISGKANSSDIPTKVSSLHNDKGYLTQHQSLASYATISSVQSSISAAKNSILGGVPATHNSLSKLKSAYELAISKLERAIAEDKSAAENSRSSMASLLNAEISRAKSSESSISNSVVAEASRAQNKELLLDRKIPIST